MHEGSVEDVYSLLYRLSKYLVGSETSSFATLSMLEGRVSSPPVDSVIVKLQNFPETLKKIKFSY